MPAESVIQGLRARKLMAQERQAITRTIGEIFNHKMRGSPVDAAVLYHAVGGESDFTYRLFAETFGSSSLGIEGVIDSDPTVDTSMDEVNAALIKVARRLAETGVTNISGRATGIRELGRIDPANVGLFADGYTCIRIGLVDQGVLLTDGGDPLRFGLTTWLFTERV